MNLIGTHNSGTGEKGKNIFCKLFTIFSRCLTKTITEQFESGVRLFDLRINENMELCHGLWKTAMTVDIALNNLYELAKENDSKVYVMVTYEYGLKTDIQKKDFIALIHLYLAGKSDYIEIVNINVKRPVWTVLETNTEFNIPIIQEYEKLIFPVNPKAFLPIPVLWDVLCHRPHIFNDTEFKLIDFA